MRKTVAVFAIAIAFAAAMTPVAMANVRALHLCCPPKAQPQHDTMEHCDRDMNSGSGAAMQSDMSDCSRHMLSTPAPGAVQPAERAIVGKPVASHPILDEFAPLFAPASTSSPQHGRAPPAGQ